jgi:cytochrome c oxidase accessory protein FixG
MTSSNRFTRRRRAAFAAQAAIVLGLPFLSVGGESALRLDVPAGRLHAFGASFAIDEAFVVLAATVLATAAFLLVTLVLGRVWCGWACPQTVLGDLTALIEPERRSGVRRWRRPLGFVLVGLVSAVVSANLLWYFVPPGEFLRRLASGTLGPVLAPGWGILFAVVFLDLALLRARFCATVCPYAKLQGVLFDRSTLIVAYDTRRDADCVDCLACVRVCPTRIDIRDGLQAECIACAACIDACTPIMARLGRAPDLVGYFFGEPGGEARPLRAGVVALGMGTLAAAALLVAVVAGRSLLGLTVVADETFRPRRTPDGKVLNAYRVGLENRGRAPFTVALGASAPGAEVTLSPESVTVAPGARRTLRVVALARGLGPARVECELAAEARADGERIARRTERIPIAPPEDF